MNEIAANSLFAPGDRGPETRRFTTAVAVALTLHIAALSFAIMPTAPPRLMGEETGNAEGLTVEIVDASELASRSAPSAAASVLTPASEPLQPAKPEPQTAPPAEQQASLEPLQPPDLKPSASDEAPPPDTAPAAPPAQATSPAALEKMDPDLLKLTPGKPDAPSPAKPQPSAKPARSAKPVPSAKPDKPDQLSLAVPTPSFTANDAASNRNASVSRPEGITRSGLNDEFGRGVVRALRQTMPPPSGEQRAQATVRFVLTADGNLQEVAIVASSGDPILDRNIVFAVKQSNFPIPATNLTALDRQFRVTYIYR